MKNEMKAKEVAYNWFLTRQRAQEHVAKDVFLYDRELWDSMQSQLVEVGENPNHDEVKELVRRMDKGGWLGGIAEMRSFEDQSDFINLRRFHQSECGHSSGPTGIAADIQRYADKINPPKLAEYYRQIHWSRRSREYRESKNWTCELCLKKHQPGSGSLVTHHLSYELEDGSCALYSETDRELMAVCASPCHHLADIARYLRSGKITEDQIHVAVEPLLAYARR